MFRDFKCIPGESLISWDKMNLKVNPVFPPAWKRTVLSIALTTPYNRTVSLDGGCLRIIIVKKIKSVRRLPLYKLSSLYIQIITKSNRAQKKWKVYFKKFTNTGVFVKFCTYLLKCTRYSLVLTS